MPVEPRRLCLCGKETKALVRAIVSVVFKCHDAKVVAKGKAVNKQFIRLQRTQHGVPFALLRVVGHTMQKENDSMSLEARPVKGPYRPE